MIASLPMYDRPELRAETDRYWQLIRQELAARGIDAPETLLRGADDLMPQWLSPDLTLSQTCGFPYRARLHGTVELVGTPDFGNDGCPPGHYRSILIARAGDPRDSFAQFDGARLAYNDALSQSGWAAPVNDAIAQGIRLIPGPQTGSHRASVAAVAEGRADLAAIDALTWALISEFDDTSAVRPIGATTPTPPPPCPISPPRAATPPRSATPSPRPSPA